MTNTAEPFDHANEADVAEQQQGLDGAGTTTPPQVPPTEANEADVLEQGAEVVSDDEDDHPREPGEPRDEE